MIPGGNRWPIIAFTVLAANLSPAFGAPGDWPQPRQNPQLTATQPLPGDMAQAPRVVAKFELPRQVPPITAVQLNKSHETVGIALVGGALRAYRTDGSLRWECRPAGLNFTQLIAAGDFDGSDRTLLALEAGRPADPLGAAVLVDAESGKLIWRYDVEPMSYQWYLFVGNYLPGTKTRQLVVMEHGYPPDPKNGYIALFDFPKPTAPPVQKWRYDFDQYTCFPQLRMVNLRGDGAREMAIISHSRMWLLNPQTGHKDDFVQWNVAPANIRSYGLDEFTDLDGDGKDDFLCIANFSEHHEVLLNRGGHFQEAWHQGWNESVVTGHVASTWPLPAHGIVDRGGQSIVLSMFDSQGENAWLLRVYDAVTGKLKYTMPGAIAASLVDIDGDGSQEILANFSDDPTASRPDGSAEPGDHKGACLLKPTGDKLEILWQDPNARALRGATSNGPHVIVHGVTSKLIRNPGGKYVATTYIPPPTPAEGPDFSKVPLSLGPPDVQLLAADFYGAGQNELLVYHDGIATILRASKDGSFQALAKYPSTCLPAIAHLPQTALITTTAGPDVTPTVRAIDPKTAKVFWEKSFTDPVEGLPFNPKPAYVRTGHFTGHANDDLYVWFGQPAVRSMVLDGRNGHVVWHKQRDSSIERYRGPSQNFASCWDFNGDGKEDLIFTNPDYYCVADGRTGDLLFGPSSPQTIFKQSCQGLYTFPAILAGESKSDPTVCLVGGHYFQAAMSLHAQPHWFKVPPLGEARADHEGFLRAPDGQWLMGFGRQNGKFACVDVASGKLKWEYDVNATCSDVISLDVAGDKHQAFVFGTSHGELIALEDADGKPKLVWKMDVGVPVIGAPIAADVLGSGKSQIVVCGADGMIRVFGK